ncbi:MAG: hypothetical protein AAB373_06150 [Patescibacteria group bacterium]
MAEAMQTLGELREEAGGVITIKSHESNDDTVDVREFNTLIWTAHHRPTRDQEIPLNGLSKNWQLLQDFYSNPEGKAFKDIGDILGDVGATEISQSIFDRLNGVKGIKPLWVYPSLGGRIVIDWNRIPGMAAADIPRSPDGVHEQHVAMHRVGIGLLERIIERMTPQTKLVLQPHTMGSGNFGPDADAIVDGGKALDPLSPDYQSRIVGLVEIFREMYNKGCNQGPARPDVDLITRYRDASIPALPDAGFADRFEARLLEVGIKPERNNPFPHAPGYPGSALIERLQKKRGELGLAPAAQGLFDVAKRLIQTGPTFDALDFVVSEEGVEKIAKAVELAVDDVL